MRASLGYGDPELQRGAAWGYLTLLASWSGRHFTDMHFPEFMVRRVCGRHAEWFVKACQAAGLLAKRKTKSKDGDLGWQFVDNGDDLLSVLTKEQVEANKHRNAGRRNGMKVAVRVRDGDQCRYCGRAVEFAQRRGWMRGTYLPGHMEHPDPEAHERLVVACGWCDEAKGKRTPEEWGVTLRDVPAQPIYNASTLNLFAEHGITDPVAERARVLVALGDGSSSGSSSGSGAAHLERSLGVAVLAPPGRVGSGSGRDGTGQVGAGSVAALRPVPDGDGPVAS
jgi:hypothetical protein